MNTFLVNAAALDGSIEVWSDVGDASISTTATGDVIYGRPGIGTAGVTLQATGVLTKGLVGTGSAGITLSDSLLPMLQLFPSGSASLSLAAAGEALYGRAAEGSASLNLAASGFGLRWVMGQSAASIVFTVNGDAQAVPQTSASFAIVWSALLDGRAATVQNGAANLIVEFNGVLQEKVARAHRLVGSASFTVGAAGTAYSIIQSPPGQAATSLKLTLQERLAGQVYAPSGWANLTFATRGDLTARHYVYADCSARIEFAFIDGQHGNPLIPSFYIEAPTLRALQVADDMRRFTVPAERRL